MKRSLKKLSALLLLAGLLVMTGCASSKETLPNEAEYQAKLDSYVEMLAAYDAESLDAQLNNLEENYDDFEQQVDLYPYIGGTGKKFDFTADAYLSLLKSYDANIDEFGEFVDVKEYEGGTTDKDGNVTYSAVYAFTDHDMRLSLEFNKDNVVTTVTMDPIYSTGEIAKKAALNTLIGMGSVFVVLILLAFIISLFRYVSVFENRGKAKKAEAEKAAAPAPAAAPAAPAETAPADDLQLIAVITAAIAAAEGTSTDGFVVRSIKRRSNNKWNKA